MIEKSPLQGKVVLITRAREQAVPFAREVEAKGGTAVIIPLLSFEPPANAEEINQELRKLEDYQWLVFTSANGVRYFFSHLEKAQGNRLIPETLKVAAVGKKTARKLQEYGVRADLLPEEYTAEKLSEAMKKSLGTQEHVLIIRGNRSREILAGELTSNSFSVKELMVYHTILNTEAEQELRTLLESGRLDYAAFASPSAVDGFMQVIKQHGIDLKRMNVQYVCIGPITEEALAVYGIKALVPSRYTMEDMLTIIAEHAAHF
ncbi:uroporphyrinogen-III synthase [Metabacillus sp. RGM 3146]|uniref:uroporphyrinogen-III synthase n=1 Tax=Metabacillus sp. RGM 3146 TaxID=3401092 RepID=UPI003B9D61F9